MSSSWEAGPRTAVEIKEAATWFRRAARVAVLMHCAQAALIEKCAHLCDEIAVPMLAKEEAEAAAARAAAEAEAAKARAAAEAKATAAAE